MIPGEIVGPDDDIELNVGRPRGCRLDIPAGTAVRFEPGIAIDVDVVPLAGHRIVAGLRGEVAGALDGSS